MKAVSSQLKTLLLGGILPIVVFTVIENQYGTMAGLIAGMGFGIGEILWEWRRQGRVESFTWLGNGMLLILGGLSLFTTEGYWFKLQPAILEAAMGALLIGSSAWGRPLPTAMAEKQGTLAQMRPEIRPEMLQNLRGLTLRLGLFFIAQAALATWAAFRWSTQAWAILKGAGFTGSMIAYLEVETLLLRRRIQQALQQKSPL